MSMRLDTLVITEPTTKDFASTFAEAEREAAAASDEARVARRRRDQALEQLVSSFVADFKALPLDAQRLVRQALPGGVEPEARRIERAAVKEVVEPVETPMPSREPVEARPLPAGVKLRPEGEPAPKYKETRGACEI